MKCHVQGWNPSKLCLTLSIKDYGMRWFVRGLPETKPYWRIFNPICQPELNRSNFIQRNSTVDSSKIIQKLNINKRSQKGVERTRIDQGRIRERELFLFCRTYRLEGLRRFSLIDELTS